MFPNPSGFKPALHPAPTSPADTKREEPRLELPANRRPIPYLHRVDVRSGLNWATGVCATAFTYAGYVAAQALLHDDSPEDAQTYDPNARGFDTRAVAVGAGGFIVGALLPSGLTRLGDKCRRVVWGPPSELLRGLVDETVKNGPLTDEGLRHRLAEMTSLARRHPQSITAADLASQIARLGQVVAHPDACCAGLCAGDPLSQLKLLTAALGEARTRSGLPAEAYRAALIALAGNLPAPARPDQAKEIAAVLIDAASPAFETASQDRALWSRNAFRVGLRGAACFERHHAQVDAFVATRLQKVASDALASRRDGKHATSAADASISAFLSSQADASEKARELDALIIALSTNPGEAIESGQAQALNTFLRREHADESLAAACRRARFLLNHGVAGSLALGPQESKSATADTLARTMATRLDVGAADWRSAPCTLRAVLVDLAFQSPGQKELTGMSNAAIDPAQVCNYLRTVPVDGLKAEVEAAIHLFLKSGTAEQKALSCLAVARMLQSRRDLPQGAFLEGLLEPTKVMELMTGVAKEGGPTAAAARLMAELPRLCQLQADQSFTEASTQALNGLKASELLMQSMRANTNDPMTRQSDDPFAGGTLNHPWLTTAAAIDDAEDSAITIHDRK